MMRQRSGGVLRLDAPQPLPLNLGHAIHQEPEFGPASAAGPASVAGSASVRGPASAAGSASVRGPASAPAQVIGQGLGRPGLKLLNGGKSIQRSVPPLHCRPGAVAAPTGTGP